MTPYYMKAGEVFKVSDYYFLCDVYSGIVSVFYGSIDGREVFDVPDKVSVNNAVLVSTPWREMWLLYGGGIVNKMPNRIIGRDSDIFAISI